MAKVLLSLVLLCVMTVPCAWAAGGKSESAARDQALQKLLERIESLKLNEKQTVGEFLRVTSLKPEQYKAALLKGAEELPPTSYVEDGRAQVSVRILPNVLVENIKQVQKEALDISVLEKLNDAVTASGLGTPMAMKDIPGWTGVTARMRLDLDAAARADAVKRLVGLSEGMMLGKSALKEVMEKTAAVKEAVMKFLSNQRPASRTCYADGTVAVEMNVGGSDFWNSLADALKPAKPEETAVVDLKDLAYAAARDAGVKMIATGYARLDGKPVDAAQLTASPKPIEVPSDVPVPFGTEVK